MKYPKVPEIIKKVPHRLADISDRQWDASMIWYSKLPLRELRKRQSIVDEQKNDLHKSMRTSGARYAKESDMTAWNNLDVMESILTEAVNKKLFGN